MKQEDFLKLGHKIKFERSKQKISQLEKPKIFKQSIVIGKGKNSISPNIFASINLFNFI